MEKFDFLNEGGVEAVAADPEGVVAEAGAGIEGMVPLGYLVQDDVQSGAPVAEEVR